MLKKYLLLFATGFIFGSQFIITKYVLHAYTPLEVGMLRIVFGMLTVALLTPFFSNKNDAFNIKWYHYAIIGFLEGTLPCVLVPWGQQHVTTSIASILISIMPVFAMFFGPALIKNAKLNTVDILSIVVGFIGIVILINPQAGTGWFDEILPEFAILLAAASWALSLVLIKKLPNVSPVKLTRNILFAATIEIIPIWLIIGNPLDTHIVLLPLLAAIFLGVFTLGVVYIFYMLLIRSSGVNFASFSNYITPVAGIILGVTFLHETFNIHEVIGFIVIALALLLQTCRDLIKN